MAGGPGRTKVTRDDVARHAGVSVAVVSYVLNGGPRRVAPGTAERVRRAVDELGYRPSRLAAALRSGRSRTLGLITPDTTHPYLALLTRAVEDAAFARGYLLLVGNSGRRVQRERHYLGAFADLKVDGALLMSSVGGRATAAGALDDAGMPLVLLDRPSAGGHSAVLVDNAAGAELATGHLLDHGRRATACVTGPEESVNAAERRAGYERAVERAGLTPGPVRHGPYSRAFGYTVGLELLRGPDRPDAVFAASDQQAVGLLSAAYELGVNVPDELAVAAFDDIPDAAYTAPPLTTVTTPVDRLADEAVALVLDGTRGRTVRLPVTLRCRRSCGCTAEPATAQVGAEAKAHPEGARAQDRETGRRRGGDGAWRRSGAGVGTGLGAEGRAGTAAGAGKVEEMR